MPKTKIVMESDKLRELEEETKAEKERIKKEHYETIQREKVERKVNDARKILDEFEDRYTEAKEIFSKVNGARRILKSAGVL